MLALTSIATTQVVLNGFEIGGRHAEKTFFFFYSRVIALATLRAQEIQSVTNSDSISSCSSYLFWIDGGKYPFLRNSHTGDFLPKYNLRLGIGKPVYFLQLYGFAEWTHYKFDPLDVLLPNEYASSSAARNDIALYGMISAFKIFSLGLGAYYTHQDNTIGHDYSGTMILETGVRSYVHIYYLIGLGSQIEISNSISFPIGLYFWNYDYPRQEHWGETTLGEKFSVRLGVIYTPFAPNAQEIQPTANTNSFFQHSRNAIYAEIYGPGILYSVNYERFISGNSTVRVGASTFTTSYNSGKEQSRFFVFPLIAYYLVGSGSSKFEAGGGIDVMMTRAKDYGDIEVLSSPIVSSATAILLVGSIGYRYQPLGGGFHFRIAFNPLLSPYTGFFIPTGGLSVGVCF